MNRKWIYALAAMAAVTLVMFPVNLLLIGKSPLYALVRSLFFGLPALLTAWTPKERRPAGEGGKPIKQLSRAAKIVWGVIAAVVLAAMFVHTACTEGIGAGVTDALGFLLIILVAAVGYRYGYLKI